MDLQLDLVFFSHAKQWISSQLLNCDYIRPRQLISDSFKNDVIPATSGKKNSQLSQKTTTMSNSTLYGDDILKNRWSTYLICLQDMNSLFKTSSLL